ncbi:DNA cytosine methyltransferase [Pseudanabaena sp. PCC 6802]|uniref:DNA cytosine methyltransferase n=1 Tax=Pseudanabaena sp. PCC 6802 TaxID=118173 RepID=UPI0012E9E6D3|nr:DNA cytosine methyltransferase [Pseudanabaena sp. PCC 6802]
MQRSPLQTRSKTYKPTVLDLFCGAGGMSLGFQNAGCQILGGIDINPHAIRTHHRNFPDSIVKLPASDITRIKPSMLLPEGSIDILIGAPPCQVFSVVGIGKMKHLGRNPEDDPRNFLYKRFVDFLHYYRPRFFVMENVNTLANKAIFEQIREDLERGQRGQRRSYPGYDIDYRVLLSADYGVPQLRKRLFVVGRRKDLDLEFVFPTRKVKQYVSVGQAIGDLPELEPAVIPLKKKNSGPRQWDTENEQPYLCEPQSRYQRNMRQGINDGQGVLNHICRAHNEVDLEIFGWMDQGEQYRDLPEEMRRYRNDIFEDKYKRLHWDEPSWTLTAHMRKDGLAYIHPTQARSISVREAARLHSFPDRFVFDAPMTFMFELIGNSTSFYIQRKSLLDFKRLRDG